MSASMVHYPCASVQLSEQLKGLITIHIQYTYSLLIKQTICLSIQEFAQFHYTMYRSGEAVDRNALQLQGEQHEPFELLTGQIRQKNQ